jgi:transcriptional regulator with XRE-family HTH domain
MTPMSPKNQMTHCKRRDFIVSELVKMRKATGKSAEDVAKDLGMYRTYLYKIESGERVICLVELHDLLHYYGTSLANFTRRIEKKLDAIRSSELAKGLKRE